MAGKKKEWTPVDWWDDSPDAGKKPEKPDPFSINTACADQSDYWGDDLTAGAWKKHCHTGAASGGKLKKIIAVLASAAVLAVAAAAVITTRRPPPADPPAVTAPPAEADDQVSESPEMPVSLPMIENNPWYGPEYRYYYQFLTDHEKEIFTKIYDGILNFSPYVFFGSATEAEIDHVCKVLEYDCPEFFHRAGHSRYSSEGFYPEYRIDRDSYQRKCDSIHSTISALKSSFSPADDDFDRELAVYRYLIDHCDYLVAGDDTTAYADAALVDGRAQCSGYAKALDLLLRSIGIRTLSVGKSGVHAWNIVNISGEWYQCDATWDDTSTEGYRQPYVPGEDEWNGWMNLPDRLSNTEADHIYDNVDGFPVPRCDSISQSYAMRCGGYIPPGSSSLAGVIGDRLLEARRTGKKHVLMMLDDASYLDNWEETSELLGSNYNLGGWMIFPPDKSTRCIYAVYGDQ